jgi:hypothetical protein
MFFLTMAYFDIGNYKHTAPGHNISRQIMNNSSVAEVFVWVIIGEQGRCVVRVGAGVVGNLVKARDIDCQLPTFCQYKNSRWNVGRYQLLAVREVQHTNNLKHDETGKYLHH